MNFFSLVFLLPLQNFLEDGFMKIKYVVALVGMILLGSTLLYAQSYKAVATVDSNNILIGDQFHVDFTLTAPQNAPSAFPEMNAGFLEGTGIELVAKTKMDTSVVNAGVAYHQRWTLTAFDSGQFVFPALTILTPDSQILAQSQAIIINVNTINVDTTAAIRDIKPIAKVPLTFKEVFPYVLVTLLAAALVALLVWFIIKHNKKKKPRKTVVKKKEKPKVKPHIAALRALDKLKQKKLWQNGQVKVYYSELTDILRTYIDGRFDVNAMEMITPDILKEIKLLDMPEEARKDMEYILSTADLVKFAKMEPLSDDHDRCFKLAVEFVNVTAEKIENQNNEQVKK